MPTYRRGQCYQTGPIDRENLRAILDDLRANAARRRRDRRRTAVTLFTGLAFLAIVLSSLAIWLD